MQERQIVLSGEKIFIAEMREEDQEQFYAWRRDQPELMKLVRDSGIPTLEGQKAWFKRSQEPDRRMFSIILQESGELIGHQPSSASVGLRPTSGGQEGDEMLIGHGGFVDIDTKEKTGQFRITIGNPVYWGKGFGTEASGLIVQYGFQTLGFQSIWLRVSLDNERAQKSYRKLGFL